MLYQDAEINNNLKKNIIKSLPNHFRIDGSSQAKVKFYEDILAKKASVDFNGFVPTFDLIDLILSAN